MNAATRIHSADDARRLARRRLPWMIFDYIDGAAGQGRGIAHNRAVLDALAIRQRILVDVSRRSQRTTLFGSEARRPFGIAPMGLCNLSHPDADRLLAQLAARERVPLCVSTMSSTSLEALIEAAEGHAWFQLYFSGDGSTTFRLVDRARAAGYETLVLTVDVPEVGRRPRELRHGFTMPFRIGARQFVDFALHPAWSLRTLRAGRPDFANFSADGFSFDRTESRARANFDTLARLRERWPGRLVVKGVTDAEDAGRLATYGVDAIQVSSHGARQLESGPAPAAMLPAIRKRLASPEDGHRDGRLPLFYDSGIRSGEDVLKALALGADFVFIGRILQFAIAAAGEAGLERLWQVLIAELDVAMAQAGLATLERSALDTALVPITR